MMPQMQMPMMYPPPPPALQASGGGAQSGTAGKGVCFNWSKGRCTFGATCKFLHDGPGGCVTAARASTAPTASLFKAEQEQVLPADDPEIKAYLANPSQLSLVCVPTECRDIVLPLVRLFHNESTKDAKPVTISALSELAKNCIEYAKRSGFEAPAGIGLNSVESVLSKVCADQSRIFTALSSLEKSILEAPRTSMAPLPEKRQAETEVQQPSRPAQSRRVSFASTVADPNILTQRVNAVQQRRDSVFQSPDPITPNTKASLLRPSLVPAAEIGRYDGYCEAARRTVEAVPKHSGELAPFDDCDPCGGPLLQFMGVSEPMIQELWIDEPFPELCLPDLEGIVARESDFIMRQSLVQLQRLEMVLSGCRQPVERLRALMRSYGYKVNPSGKQPEVKSLLSIHMARKEHSYAYIAAPGGGFTGCPNGDLYDLH